MDELIKLFKSLFGEEAAAELEAEFKKAAKDVPEEAMKAIKSALGTLNKFKDAMPEDVLGAIKTLSKYASYGYPEAAKKTAEDLAKVGAKINKANLEALIKAAEMLQQAADMVKKVIDPALAAEPDTKKAAALQLPDTKKWLDDLAAQIKKAVGAQAGDDPEKDKDDEDVEDKDVMIARLKKENAALKKRGQPTGLKGQDDLDDEDVKKTGPKWPSLTGQK